MIADIFPGNGYPGLEIVVIYASPFSQRCIRIYDTAGSLLYQVWQDGSIGAAYWMKNEGLLVLAGDDGQRYWNDLGFEAVRGVGKYPSVIYALRPQPHFIRNEFIRRSGEPESTDPLVSAWYCFFLPPKCNRLKVTSLHPPPAPIDSASHVGVVVTQMPDEGISASITLDAKGQIVYPTRWTPSDAYRQALMSDSLSRPPDIDEIELGTWEEFLARCAELNPPTDPDEEQYEGEP